MSRPLSRVVTQTMKTHTATFVVCLFFFPCLAAHWTAVRQNPERCPLFGSRKEQPIHMHPAQGPSMNQNNLRSWHWPLPNISFCLGPACQVNDESYLGSYTRGDKNTSQSDHKKQKKNGCIISYVSSLQMPSHIWALSIMEEKGLWRCRGSVLRWRKRRRGGGGGGGVTSDDDVIAAPQEELSCKTITTLRCDLISSWYLELHISSKKENLSLESSLRQYRLHENITPLLSFQQSVTRVVSLRQCKEYTLRWHLTCSEQR